MTTPGTPIARVLAAAVLVIAVDTAHAGDKTDASLSAEVASQPPAGSVRLDLRERGGETVLVSRWRHHSRTLCCRSYPARVEARGPDGEILHRATVEYTPRRLRHKPKTVWLLTFRRTLPGRLPPGSEVRVFHGPGR